jgi:hypothetical protein
MFAHRKKQRGFINRLPDGKCIVPAEERSGGFRTERTVSVADGRSGEAPESSAESDAVVTVLSSVARWGLLGKVVILGAMGSA